RRRRSRAARHRGRPGQVRGDAQGPGRQRRRAHDRRPAPRRGARRPVRGRQGRRHHRDEPGHRGASERDNLVIIPIVLGVVFLILVALLRALVAPLLMMGTVVLSFLASLGACALIFEHGFGFEGADPGFPLLAFIFLVALGVDYNIFLMHRVREESQVLGTRRGIQLGLTVTGGVITSAGLVLAATFASMVTLPLVFMVEMGFAVAFGVLLDTFVVRSLLLPALSHDLGSRIWAPGRLAKEEPASDQPKVLDPVG